MSDSFETWLNAEIERLRLSGLEAYRLVDDYKRQRKHKAADRWQRNASEIEGKRWGLCNALCKYRELRR